MAKPYSYLAAAKAVKQHLLLLLHAYKCLKRDKSNAKEVNKCTHTNVAHCKAMKDVLTHMQSCKAGMDCPIPNCSSSRKIISHWIICNRPYCPVCSSIKEHSHQLHFCSSSRFMVSHYKDCTRRNCKDCCMYDSQLIRFRLIRSGESRFTTQKRVRPKRERMIAHSCRCVDQKCKIPLCMKMKRVIGHTKICQRKINNSATCQEIAAFCSHHAIICTEKDCILAKD